MHLRIRVCPVLGPGSVPTAEGRDAFSGVPPVDVHAWAGQVTRRKVWGDERGMVVWWIEGGEGVLWGHAPACMTTGSFRAAMRARLTFCSQHAQPGRKPAGASISPALRGAERHRWALTVVS